VIVDLFGEGLESPRAVVLRFDGRVPASNPFRDRAGRKRAIVLIGLLKLSILGAIVAAAARSGWGTLAALAVSVVIEVALARRLPPLTQALRRAGAGSPTMTALRMTAVLLLAARCLEPSIAIGTAVVAFVVTALAIAAEALRVGVAKLRLLPLVTRNLDLGDFSLPKPPPAVATDPLGVDGIVVLVAALGLTIAMHRDGSAGIATAGLAIATVVAAMPALLLGSHVATLLRAKLRSRLTEAATTAIEALAPEVVLYFAATADEIYQVQMWLEPIEALGRPAVVVLRSEGVFDALRDVTLPVICSPYNGTIASIPLPPRAVAMFVTHSGNNLSMLRRPEIRSVFVGHGDSDKPDSVNPFARVYDEVWVAGPLGRRRYEVAGVGVSDSAIVEVGRPQIQVSTGPAGQPPTILYAPTWEGWGDDPHHSSLALVGPALVEALLARTDLRVRYRPHPLTGRRDPALRAAHQRIIEMVGRVPEDESLAKTFASASGLIGDVSSVINEFLPYDRPYAVVDTRGLGSTAFEARFPSTAAGFVLGPDLDKLDAFVAAALGGPDPTSTERGDLLVDALGDPATSQQRFADAVRHLLDT
jgi:CDP-Glycerol:Poly(glycerophosphate) glycerophosphotransferase